MLIMLSLFVYIYIYIYIFEISVQYLQDFSSSAAVRGNGCNVEYALHLLHIAKGNLQVKLSLI